MATKKSNKNTDGLEGLADNFDIINKTETENNKMIKTLKKGPLATVKGEKVEITKEYLCKKLKRKASRVSDAAVKLVNDACNDDRFMPGEFLSSMVSYQNAMEKTSSSIQEYVYALRFCAFFETNDGNAKDAFIRSRPDNEFVKKYEFDKAGSPGYLYLVQAAIRYRKSPLVQAILTQSQMPLYLMFQGLRYKAVEVLANEMVNSTYAKDRINAADKLLTHVKPPENMKIELDIGVKEDSAVQQLQDQLAALAISQKMHLEAGTIDLNYTGSMKVDVSSEDGGDDGEIIDVEVER